MTTLPPEIIDQILGYCFCEPGLSPAALLTTSFLFYEIYANIVYSNLRFMTRGQLTTFISTYTYSSVKSNSVFCLPYSIEVDMITSGTVFMDIYSLFSKCFSKTCPERFDGLGRLSLDLLRLRLNSHTHDDVGMVYNALSLVNPRRFIWTGPDPPHHFSTAIVATVVPHLFRALASYTNLTFVQLSHLNMTFGATFPAIPSLREVYLGQAVFLSPTVVASWLVHPNSKSIERIQLVDAYSESIWGPRIRRSDIERAAVAMQPLQDLDDPEITELKYRIQSLVVCKAMTERIIGGDRVEDDSVLL